MATWQEKVKDKKVSKQDVLNYLIFEMKMQDRVYTRLIRQRKMTQGEAIKKAACARAAYYLIKADNEKEVGKQGKMFD